MATTTETKIPVPGDPTIPINWDDYQEEKKIRAEEQEKKRAILRRCHDATVAATYEAQKPRYDYEVSCVVMEKERKKKVPRRYTETVTALDENDAWAHFCTRIERYPSPGYCERKIKRINK